MDIQTLHVMTLLVGSLIIGWLILRNAMYLAQIYMNKKYSIKSIFTDFPQKMWMTLGLGFVFFGFYFLLVILSSSMIDSKAKQDFFLRVYKNPTPYIYLGLLIFACVSLCIYLARIVIKYLYNKRIK